MIARLLASVRGLLRRRRIDGEIAEELSDHLEREIEAHRLRGISPEEARRLASSRQVHKSMTTSRIGWEQHTRRLPSAGLSRAAGRDGSIIVWGDDGRALRPNGEFVRDETEQATYLRESLEVFAAEGVDAAFVYTFARYDLPHRDDPHVDLDMVSAGVVKVLDSQSSAGDPRGRRYPDMPWEPKAAFDALADWCGRPPVQL